jgi:hypothetical protein
MLTSECGSQKCLGFSTPKVFPASEGTNSLLMKSPVGMETLRPSISRVREAAVLRAQIVGLKRIARERHFVVSQLYKLPNNGQLTCQGTRQCEVEFEDDEQWKVDAFWDSRVCIPQTIALFIYTHVRTIRSREASQWSD